MSNTTLATVKSVARKYGATIEIDEHGDSYRIFAIAPKGKIWIEGIHSMVADVFYEWPESKIEAYLDLIERMNIGIEDCSCEECRE